MNENILDLHRVKHEEAEILIDRFINKLWDRNITVQIITGNSKEMKNIVINKLEFYNLDYKIGNYWDPNNKGYISVVI